MEIAPLEEETFPEGRRSSFITRSAALSDAVPHGHETLLIDP
jgi:hypothetical protein